MPRVTPAAIRMVSIILILLAAFTLSTILIATESDEEMLSLASAGNFAPVLEKIVSEYERQHGGSLQISTASTGKLYAQISQGAAYDLFFSADFARPSELFEQGMGTAAPFEYARGRLALWYPGKQPDDSSDLEAVLNSAAADTGAAFAVAHPKLAPYGKASRELLTRAGVLNAMRDQLVFGENISQTFGFITSGNSPLGLVSLSQLRIREEQHGDPGWYLPVPREYHSEISQFALILRDSPSLRRFLDFFHSDAGRQILVDAGYDLP